MEKKGLRANPKGNAKGRFTLIIIGNTHLIILFCEGMSADDPGFSPGARPGRIAWVEADSTVSDIALPRNS